MNAEIKELKVIAGIRCPGPLLDILDHPNGIYLNEIFTLFVADTNNHRTVRFHQNQTNGIAIAGFGQSCQIFKHEKRKRTLRETEKIRKMVSFCQFA